MYLIVSDSKTTAGRATCGIVCLPPLVVARYLRFIEFYTCGLAYRVLKVCMLFSVINKAKIPAGPEIFAQPPDHTPLAVKCGISSPEISNID